MTPLRQMPRQQRGVVMVLYTIGMVAIIGMAGLALDMGHAFLNKTRLQNALDAGALSGASSLNSGLGVAAAQADAVATFSQHLTGELGSPDSPLVPTVQFSTTLVPFVPGALDPDAPKYVRLIVADFSMSVWLAYILPGVGDTMTLGGSAVAGPRPLGSPPDGEVCDLAPFVLCADKSGGSYDTDCSDGNCYGYSTTGQTVLKTGSGTKGWDVGPGNYQLLELNCPGANCLSENLAGGNSCVVNGDSVTTKPGNNVGPVAQGFNTRFGDYDGPMKKFEADYPPDVVVTENISYDSYLERLNHASYDYPPLGQPGGKGVPMRRVLAVVFGDCSSTVNGSGDVPMVGIGCFFMTKKAQQSGDQEVYGQLVDNCRASGDVAENPGPGSGANEIVLYKDPDSGDS
jgi:Flp pilus assembly protein TadG